MIQIVYWGLELYSASVPEAKGAIDGEAGGEAKD